MVMGALRDTRLKLQQAGWLSNRIRAIGLLQAAAIGAMISAQLTVPCGPTPPTDLL